MAKPEYLIIREVYDQSGDEEFEAELDHALEVESNTIVIEPLQLGLETARWISLGNFLHKTAVLCGLSTLAVSTRTDKLYIIIPLGCTSFVCAGVYLISWQPDPCCKYQVESDPTMMDRLPLHKLSSTSPIVLVRKDDTRRKILHNSLALMSFAICCWKVYSLYS
ncbi:transmembrane protein 11, mitochondrial-like [Watersipora subatra]|uniref:transmembrane protein 11, mitochondrial-like n=1 Tax=Watersipora subatra TaxID=2589382 RepID=UPI00355B7EBB